MRLYKVKTLVELTIETNWLFKKKKHGCYFTYKSKYIYAKDKDEARMKYGDYFFTPIENGFDKENLWYFKLYAETWSKSMEFNLAFNQKVIHSHTSIYVLEDNVIANFNEVKDNMTAQDFRDWWYKNEYNINDDYYDELFE